MTTEETLKAFVETCDKDGVTLGEMTDSFKEAESTIPHPLQCNSEFCYATLNKKIRMFADYMRVERAKVFVKFINLKRVLKAAKKMRKALKQQRQNIIREPGVVEHYTQKYQKAYSELLGLLLD